MRLLVPLPAFLTAAVLVGSFATGLVWLRSPSSARPQNAGPRPSLVREHAAPQAVEKTQAEPVVQQAVIAEPEQDSTDLSWPECRNSQGSFQEALALRRNIGRTVTWVGQPVDSQNGRGTARHILFGQGPDGECSFSHVFMAVERGQDDECPGYQLIHELRLNWLKENAQRRREEHRRHVEELRRRGLPSYEEMKRSLDESRQYTKEHPPKPHGPREVLIPVYVTVTGTIARLDTLILFGHGQRYCVPVLEDVTITANP